MVENCRVQHCQMPVNTMLTLLSYCLLMPCQYWRQRLRNFCINKNKMVYSAGKIECRWKFCIKRKVAVQSSRLWDLGSAAGACLPLKNSWRQPLDGSTYRGAVRLGSQHHVCCSESVAHSSAWVLMGGTLSISCNSNIYLSFELIPTVFIVLETCVLSVSSKR